MANVVIQLPSVLSPIMQNDLEISIRSSSIADAFATIARDRPDLALHLFDESGGLREHVLCFHNNSNTRWLDSLDEPLSDGDTLMFMQAVSGG